MGWRGPLSRPVSLMTGALRLAAGWLVCAAAGTAIHTAIATPTPTLPPLFVIRSARWRLDRCVCGTACGRRNVAPPRKRAQVGARLFRPRQQLVFQRDHAHERVDRLQIGELHPAPAHPARHAPVADGLARGPRQSVGHAELTLLALAQDERAREAGLHRMQVGELAPAHLVHPHPLPRRSHEHHLLGHVPQRPDPFPRPLEPLGGPGRQVLERRVGLGTLARAGVEIGRPVARRLVLDRDHGPYCKRPDSERKRCSSAPCSVCRVASTPSQSRPAAAACAVGSTSALSITPYSSTSRPLSRVRPASPPSRAVACRSSESRTAASPAAPACPRARPSSPR